MSSGSLMVTIGPQCFRKLCRRDVGGHQGAFVNIAKFHCSCTKAWKTATADITRKTTTAGVAIIESANSLARGLRRRSHPARNISFRVLLTPSERTPRLSPTDVRGSGIWNAHRFFVEGALDAHLHEKHWSAVFSGIDYHLYGQPALRALAL